MTYAPTQLIFSWPPARPAGVPAGPDGLYDASEYCDMMKHVDMDPSQLKAGPGELRTNCTTRYGAHHLVTTEGLHRTVASVFIPYGRLIFACFQTIKAYELPRNQNSYATQANDWRKGHTHQSVGDKMDPAATEHSSNAPNRHTEAQNQLQHALAQRHSQSEAAQPQHSAIDWSTDSSLLRTRQGSGNDDWDSSVAYELGNLGMAVHEPGSQAVSNMSQHQEHQADGSHAASSGATYSTNAPSSSFYSPSEYGNPLYSAVSSQTQSSTSVSSAAQMASIQSSSSTSSATGQRPIHSQSLKGSIARAVQSGAPPQSSGKSSTRPLVRPPGDVEACVMCGTKESPEWRKNTNGVKDLCNA